MNNIEGILEQLGLVDSEIKLYLALLELGPQGAHLLAQKTNIKRANIYYFIESLKEKGLVSQFSDMSGVRYFRAESPDRLLEMLNSQKNNLAKKESDILAIMPELKRITNIYSVAHPRVRFYENKKAVAQLYKNIFSHKEILAIANIDAVGALFPEYAWGLFELVRKENIRIKEIIVETASAKKYRDGVYKNLHQVKILPKNYQFNTDILIYKHEVAFISFRKVITACLIEDRLIYEAHKSIFESLWEKLK